MANDQKLYEANRKLCCAVEVHACIYDRTHSQYMKKEANDEAWSTIARECEDTVASCKWRWRNIRTAFLRSVQGTPKKRTPNRTREYYLHEVLQFFIPHIVNVVEPSEKGAESDGDDEKTVEKEPDVEATPKTDESKSAEPKEETEKTATKQLIDDEATTSADETAGEEPEVQPEKSRVSPAKSKVKTFFIKEKPTKVGTFIIGKIPEIPNLKQIDLCTEEAGETIVADTTLVETNSVLLKPDPPLGTKVAKDKNELEDDERRFRFKRACKRGLDRTVMKALSKRENRKDVDLKRQRRSKSLIKPSSFTGEDAEREHKIVRQQRYREKRAHSEVKSQLPQIIIPSDVVETQMKFSPAPETAGHEEWLQDFVVAKQHTPTVTEQTPLKDLVAVTFVDQAIQCTPTSTVGDDDFLNALRPQMAEMNARQKLHFKKKVYESLMEVFDSVADFPDTGATVLNSSLYNPLQSSTSNDEIRLIRELVALVQAAKQTSNSEDDSNASVIQTVDKMVENSVLETEASTIASTMTSPISKSIPTLIKPNVNTANVASKLTAGATYVMPTSRLTQPMDPANLPQHIIQRVVKIGDRGGGNLITKQGDRRRIYRIYPRGSVPKSVQNGIGSGGSGGSGGGNVSGGAGTFIIPRALPNSSRGMPTTTTTAIPTVGHRQVNVPSGGSIWPINGSASSTSASNIAADSGSFTTPAMRRTMVTRSKIRVNDGTEKHIVRRYSICGAGTLTPTTIGSMPSANADIYTNNTSNVLSTGVFQRLPTARSNTIITTSTKTLPTATVTSIDTSASLPIPGFNKYITTLNSNSKMSTSTAVTTAQTPPINFDSTLLRKQSFEDGLAKTMANERFLCEMQKKMRKSMSSSAHKDKNSVVSMKDNTAMSSEETAATIASDNFAAFNIKDEPMDDSF